MKPAWMLDLVRAAARNTPKYTPTRHCSDAYTGKDVLWPNRRKPLDCGTAKRAPEVNVAAHQERRHANAHRVARRRGDERKPIYEFLHYQGKRKDHHREDSGRRYRHDDFDERTETRQAVNHRRILNVAWNLITHQLSDDVGRFDTTHKRSTDSALVAAQPFGDVKLSGTGIPAGGPDYLKQFMWTRIVSEHTMCHGFVP
jgi:hypothetical protein